MSEKREDFKKVKIKDREFIVSKFDALTGSYMLLKVGNILLPILGKVDVTKIDKDNPQNSLKGIDLASIAIGLTSLTKEDFSYIQIECLKVCHEDLPAGKAPVITPNGQYGINNVDTKLALVLTVHALIFNVNDFFGDDLSDLMSAGLTSFK